MYPSFTFLGITVYTFGLALSVSLGLFVWMLYRLSLKYGINTNFFLGNILFFFLSSFLFSRLFYILAEWRDYKYIFGEGVFKFFFMSDYNFSLIGALFGFFLILYINIRKFKLSGNKYVDAVFLSFLFASVLGFIGAFFGGQICGKATSLAIGMSYLDYPDAKCAISASVFPLSLIYAVASFVLFSTLYILRQFIQTEGFVGYIGILLFACILFVGEFFSGNTDIFQSTLPTFIQLNLNQIGALGLLAIGVRGLVKIYRQ